MKKFFPFAICLILIFAVIHANISFAIDKEDSQLWTETWIYLPKFSPDFSYGYINNTRIGHNVSKVTDERQSVFLTYNFSKELNFTSQNSFVEQRPEKDTHKIQYRPIFDIHGNLAFPSIILPYRLRTERQLRESSSDKWNFRPRIGIQIPNTFSDIPFDPFINTEGFYDSDLREWYRLRTLAGFVIKPCSLFTIEPYIGRQLERRPSAVDLMMFGFNLKMFFT